METVRGHLGSEVHRHLSELHKDVASHFASESGRCKEAGCLPESQHNAELANCFTKSAEHFARCADAMEHADKAAQDALNKLVPGGIRSVAVSDSPSSAFGINDRTARAIPRVGAPPMPATLDKSAVPAQFSHLVSNMEEGE
jgi:hypothetical protein